MSKPYRVLVTGSRTWDDTLCISFELGLAIGQSGRPLEDVVVVSGGCPTGADAVAERVAEAYNYRVERHPADWESYGKSAGHRRNAEMVALGADICLAFIRNGSRGATHCASAAEKAGIPVRRFEDDRVPHDHPGVAGSKEIRDACPACSTASGRRTSP